MGKFDGILICTDLDGTLYNNEKTISKENKQAIEYFKREGGYFTFITGRMPSYSADAFRAVNPNTPYGCINGGGLYDGYAATYVWTHELSKSIFDLIEFAEQHLPTIGIQVCTFDKTYFSNDNDATARFRARTGEPHLIRPYREVTEPIGKIIFASEIEDELTALAGLLTHHSLADSFDFVRSERTLFEVLPKGVNKGLALSKLADFLKVDMKKTVAIGDYDNDIAMIQAAGLGIAVANARPEVLAAADHVTVSNEEHAIAKVIESLENGTYALR